MKRKLERALAGLAIPHLTLYLVVLQAFGLVLAQAHPDTLDRLYLVPSLVLGGEYWRLVSFFCIPPTDNLIFAFFALYMLYLMGTALEAHWGAPRYNLYVLSGYLATVLAGFAYPYAPVSNAFLDGSIFLAFAFLYPDFQLYLFLILPVRIKWVAAFVWATYLWKFATGDGAVRLLVLASTANFFLFFGREIAVRMRYGSRRMKASVRAKQDEKRREEEPFHRCRVCGKTDKSDPTAQFRYCPECVGSPGYCMEHIHAHEHVK